MWVWTLAWMITREIDGTKFCGTSGPQGVQVASGEVAWTSDSSTTDTGWELCWPPPSLSPPSPPSPPVPPLAPPKVRPGCARRHAPRPVWTAGMVAVWQTGGLGVGLWPGGGVGALARHAGLSHDKGWQRHVARD
eukprot:5977946-Prymnesium_polylepis.1